MVRIISFAPLLLVFMFLSGCAGRPFVQVQGTTTPAPLEAPAQMPAIATSLSSSGGLFLETAEIVKMPTAAHVARSRFVRLNLAMLLDDSGHLKNFPAGTEIVVNLFPDVVYTGVIEQVSEDGGGQIWTGHLKDIEYSSLTVVYTGGTFIAKFASPAGVYEVSSVGGDLYQVILIDQQKLPGQES